MLLEADSTGLPAEIRDDLAVLHRQAKRVARVTQGLLSFARQSSGERMPVDLNHILRETLLLAERQMTKAGIRVTTRLDADLPAIAGDANTLQQVVLNLVTNAWDAVDPGEITLETRVLPERANGGAGRDRHRSRHRPGDGSRGSSTRSSARSQREPGSGSITDGIVREHGGTIDVESRPGTGTRFVLTFPSLSSSLTRGA